MIMAEGMPDIDTLLLSHSANERELTVYSRLHYAIRQLQADLAESD